MTEVGRRNLAITEMIDTTMMMEMKWLETDSHGLRKVLPREVFKEPGCDLPRIEKRKKTSVSTMKTKLDAQLDESPVTFNSNLSRDVLSKRTGEPFAEALRRLSYVNNMKEPALNIQTVMYALQRKEPRTIYSKGTGKRDRKFSLRVPLTAIRAVQRTGWNKYGKVKVEWQLELALWILEQSSNPYESRPENSSNHLSSWRGVVRNKSPGFQAFVGKVPKWSKIDLIRLKQLQAAGKRH